jgi:hypothetical protein
MTVEPILIEVRDGPEAARLVETLVEACPAVPRSAGDGWEIVVATDADESRLLRDVLAHVQEWLDRSDSGSVVIRFQGRAYTFEPTAGARRGAAA